MGASYYVLLGDVVSSRNIADRSRFQLRLQQACEEASSKYSSSFHAKLKLLKGTDEIGGVLHCWHDIYKIISLVLDRIHPYQIRFSLVKGEIDVNQLMEDVAVMDGPAFHDASHMIDNLRRTGLLFRAAIGDSLTNEIISNQLSMLLFLRQQWTGKQFEVVMEYQRNDTQNSAAKRLNIRQQDVSRILKQINWKQYRLFEISMSEQLRSLATETCNG